MYESTASAATCGSAASLDGVVADPATAALVDIAVRLRGLADDLEASEAEVARARTDALAQVQSALAVVRARVIRAAESTRAHEVDGAPSDGAWLRDRLGVGAREAARESQLARDLEFLPATAGALAAGEIGPGHAAAIGRAHRRGRIGDSAATEAQLLPAAKDLDPDSFCRQIRRVEQQADNDALLADERRQRRLRELRIRERDDGLWELHALADRGSMEVIGTALRAFCQPDPAEAPPEVRRDFATRQLDALVAICDSALRAGDGPVNGGVRPQVTVIVPAEALADPGSTAPGEGGVTGPISAELARRLACDAALHRAIVRAPSDVLDLGRATRSWSVAQRRAVTVRDGGCRGPCCDRPPGWCDIHHILWWERDRGPTDVRNGILLCHDCHALVHEDGWTVGLDPPTATATWTSPSGATVVTKPRPVPGVAAA